MKLKTKLYLGFGSILVIIVILCVNVFYTMNQQKEHMNAIVNENYERVKLIELLRNEINTTAREIRELLLMSEDAVMKEHITIIQNSRINTSSIFAQLENVPHINEESQQLVSKLKEINTVYFEVVNQVIQYSNDGNYEAGVKVFIDDYRDMRGDIVEGFDRLTFIEEEAMNQALLNAQRDFQVTVLFLVSLIVVTAIIVISITISVVRSITKSIYRVRDVITRVPGHVDEQLPRIEVIEKDEIGEIGQAYNEMAHALEVYSKQEKDFKKYLENENWVKTKFAELMTKFQGQQNLQRFGELFISKVASSVDATYGAFYIKDEDVLNRLAAYAPRQNETVGDSAINLGQGLVGQCVLDKKLIHVNALPEGYIATSSGLGEASPTALVIIPIELDGEVLGVIELAKFEEFSSLQMKLLKQVSVYSGAIINRIINHMQIEKLLSESQTLTEELQTQSEELQQQQEELRLTNEQLHLQYKHSDEKTKELEKIKLDLEEKNRGIELSSKYKSEFLANMSHELRTPLNSMLILSQILSENNEGNLTEKQIEYALTIHSSGSDLLDLINDILDLSKIESGKIDIYPEQILLDDVKAFVGRQFNPVARHKGLSFHIIMDEDVPKVIFTDDQRLKQILKNLLSNAFKFTKSGSVELRFSKGRDDVRSKIVFSVFDTGIGIPKEKQQTIFEAFFQGDGTTSRQFGGTGLGLSITRELSQLLGGYVTIDSTEGKGSIFSLHLPDYYELSLVHQPSIAEVAATQESNVLIIDSETHDEVNRKESKVNEDIGNKEPFDNKVVLVVDDDMRNIFAITTALEMQNMKVLFAENGKEAVEIVNNDRTIDIILMDIMMPEMDGYEAMQHIRENKDFQDLPIIALTAKAMKSDKEKCINAGASDYISKPVNMEQLLSLIKVWLYK
ncbi:response regulator [Alkalihalobacterium alkalinitrilicum]|uniref:response regulator n=1 Tax=Alkalihalobacterium alkalinitrilicum TaxID=427920 RepID=UPI0013030B80|nr:response regulator [Alkalihalobacterium alkalinitrilicum]